MTATRDAYWRMPDDFAEAFHSMRLAILRHRADGWQEFSEDDAVQLLWVLMQVAMDKGDKA